MVRNISHRTAFTLVELMVSIFLLMLVMVGVNTVFSTTSATVGTNTAISSLNRDARAMQAVLGRDFANVASDSAAFVIKNEQIFAFRNLQDYNSDPTQAAPNTADLTGSGTESSLLPAQYNFRSHRVDRLSFFTRQLLQRQTGNDGTFVANQTTPEQWIWLGHLRLPDNTAFGSLVDANYVIPASGTPTTNPNNLFASQWALGRMAMGLVKPTYTAGDKIGTIYDRNSVSQNFIYRNTDLDTQPAQIGTSMSPLAIGSNSTTYGTPAPSTYLLQESRYDLAGTSISAYSQVLRDYITTNPGTNWWTNLMYGPTSRFRGMPYANRPLSSAAIAQMAPILTSSTSQFIVEFAGDFVKQDPTKFDTPATTTVTDCFFDSATGALKPAGQDGEIDYIITGTAANPKRSIRWYGMPRSTTGNTTINVTNGDVCPLRDTIRLAGGAYANLVNTPIERVAPANGSAGGADARNNLLPNTFKATPTDYNTIAGSNGGMPATVSTGFFYYCAWGPSDTVRPKLIRILITLEDTTGRLPDGQTYEYVFALP